MAKEVTIPARVVHEEIYMYTHSPHEKIVTVEVAYGKMDQDGVFTLDRTIQYECHRIKGVDYSELMSKDGGGLVPGKPEGVFRIEDLRPFVDRSQARKAEEARIKAEAEAAKKAQLK